MRTTTANKIFRMSGEKGMGPFVFTKRATTYNEAGAIGWNEIPNSRTAGGSTATPLAARRENRGARSGRLSAVRLAVVNFTRRFIRNGRVEHPLRRRLLYKVFCTSALAGGAVVLIEPGRGCVFERSFSVSPGFEIVGVEMRSQFQSRLRDSSTSAQNAARWSRDRGTHQFISFRNSSFAARR